MRRRLIWLLVTLAGAVAIGFVVAMRVDLLGVVIEPIRPYLQGAKLKYLSPTDPFFVTLRLGVMVGLVLALPVILYHLQAIVRPLVPAGQQRRVRPLALGAAALFVTGATFCFYAVVPLMLRFTLGFQVQSLEQHITIGAYLTLVTHMMLAFGLAFELPVGMLIGTMIGLLTPAKLAAYRRHAIVAATALGALLTPPDVASQVLMAVPLYILYEIGIVVSRIALAREPIAQPLPEP